MNLKTTTTSKFCRLVNLALVVTSLTKIAVAAEKESPAASVDKSRYHLLNPVPAEYLREMSTDRPDKTESPFTVDAGHYQLEADLISYAYDRDRSGGADTRTRSFAIAPMNFKVGICNRVDLQLVVETYNNVRTEDRIANTSMRQSGFGDITTRLKVNLWGNDGGSTACALMPFAKLPTNQDQLGNSGVEGGLIVPLAVKLPADFDMGLMTEFDLTRNSTDNRYHSEFINTVTFGHDIVGNLGGYVEFFSAISTEHGSRWIGTVDLGLTYGLTKNIQLDAGINIGITKSADDWNPFLGLSVRF